jgi:murein DD-endopeptidase MepM/ murein hydrolase activator NlpD
VAGRAAIAVAGPVALAALCAPALATPAQDGTGGATPAPSPAPTATPAPTPAPRAAPPVASRVRIARLACAAGCGAANAARPGALLRVRGRAMKRGDEVAFLGADGEADDVSAAPVKRRRTSLDVRVPLAAVSGPVLVLDRDGVPSKPSPAPLAVEAAPPRSGAPSIDVDVQAPRAYFDAAKPMRVSYVVHGSQAASVQVELVREADSAVIARWTPGEVAPETPQVVQWDGLAGGQVQREGRYSFRVSATDQAGLRASSAQNGPEVPGLDPEEFVFLRHQFPVRGPHGYGEFEARFGGGRGHQGQDVFGACGTPIVAARGGTVKFKQYHSAAGNYIVIDGEKTGTDYGYMHLKEAALVDKGERVRTGQLIGYLGDTGHASACHLHFEMWTKPGWYSGGQPFDPLPSLLAWDALS